MKQKANNFQQMRDLTLAQQGAIAATPLGLRPTTDRVKETLFNWLMHDTAQSTVLDCFAGSGSLGLEALSRYADYVTLVEKAPALARQLQRHLDSLSASNAEVVNADCLQWLQRPALRQYNLVLIDPPFRQGLALPCCQALEQHSWLSDSALIYLETEKELALIALVQPMPRIGREQMQQLKAWVKELGLTNLGMELTPAES